jgi:hypothetical protein
MYCPVPKGDPVMAVSTPVVALTLYPPMLPLGEPSQLLV